jgi:hypothetical protein
MIHIATWRAKSRQGAEWRRTKVREDLDNAGGEAALGLLRDALHEENDLVVGNDLTDLAEHLRHLFLLGGRGGGGSLLLRLKLSRG